MTDASGSGTTNNGNVSSSTFINARPPAPFDIHAQSAAERWEDWKLEFETYAGMIQLSSQPSSVQRCAFLRAIGLVGHKLFKTFEFNNEQERNDLTQILAKFDTHFAPQRDELFQAYLFRQRSQKPHETFDEWLSELRILADTCNFQDALERNLKEQIVCGVASDILRQRMLKNHKKDKRLESMIELGRIFQQTESYQSTFAKIRKAESVHPINTKKSNAKSTHNNYNKVYAGNTNATVKSCRYCGKSHARGSSNCPAYGVVCNACSKKNHYASVCQQKSNDIKPKKQMQTHTVAEQLSDNLTLHIEALTNSDRKNIDAVDVSKPWYSILQSSKGRFKVKLDTGADCNIISKDDATRLKAHISTDSVILEPYGGGAIIPVGRTMLDIMKNGKLYKLSFRVLDGHYDNILGRDDCEKLGFIRRSGINEISMIADIGKCTIHNLSTIDPSGLLNSYRDCFTGLGKFGQPHHIELEPNAVPVARSARPIPNALYPKVKEALQRMTNLGIIEPVTKPTRWCSNLTVAMKSDKSLRICIDPVDLKHAIRRPQYPMQTIENIATRMHGAKFITVIDADMAFWQIPVDSESADLLVFATPFGRYRFLRLPFGIPDASEVFQKRAVEFAAALEGVEVIIDDFLIWGRTREEHDSRVGKFFDKARTAGLKFKESKIQWARSEVKYCGHLLSTNGLSADPKKIVAIVEYPTPHDKEAVARFLGIISYLQKFIPNASNITAPLRKLVVAAGKSNDIQWNQDAQESFDSLKKILSAAPVLGYYNINDDTTLSVDSSSHGLGAVIMQGGKPIAYASRALTPTQQRYAQIEKELLAVVFGCQRFDTYLFGKKIFVETDHKPLVSVIRKPLSEAPARLQRMLMVLQRYDIHLSYVPGKRLFIADALSRAHLSDSEEMPDAFRVCLVTEVSSAKWAEFKCETNEDPVLAALRDTVLRGWPMQKEDTPLSIREFWLLRDSLTIQDDVILYNDRVVVPKSMRKCILTLIHEGHLGIELCKRRARQAVYWPHMNADISNLVLQCDACQSQARANMHEPLIRHDIPVNPFEKVAMDAFECHGHHLVLVDYTSGYIEATSVSRSPNTQDVIAFCKRVFRTHGIPKIFFSDNGTIFTSSLFKEFADNWGFSLRTSSPEYPQSNGLAENAVKTVKKILTACKQTNDDINLALLNLNTAPREDGFSPAERLFNRKPRTRLSTSNPEVASQSLVKQIKPNAVSYYNVHTKELPELVPGDSIRMRVRNKSWRDAVVIKKLSEPRSYLVKSDGTIYRRNRRHLILRKEKDQRVEDQTIQTNNKSYSCEEPEVGDEDSYILTTNWNIAQNTPSTDQQVVLRRSKRARRPPVYFDQYATDRSLSKTG